MPSLGRAAGRRAGLSQPGDRRWEHRGATRERSWHCQELSLQQELDPEHTVPDRCQVWGNKRHAAPAFLELTHWGAGGRNANIAPKQFGPPNAETFPTVLCSVPGQ